MCEVPQRRDMGAQMRIVGKQRLAAGGQRAIDDPVVRSQRFGLAAEQQIAHDGIPGDALRESRRPRLTIVVQAFSASARTIDMPRARRR